MIFQIPYVNALENLKTLPLVELNLEGNPLKTRINDQTVYVRYLFDLDCVKSISRSLCVNVASGSVSSCSPEVQQVMYCYDDKG